MLPIASAATGSRLPVKYEIGGASTAWDKVKGIKIGFYCNKKYSNDILIKYLIDYRKGLQKQ